MTSKQETLETCNQELEAILGDLAKQTYDEGRAGEIRRLLSKMSRLIQDHAFAQGVHFGEAGRDTAKNENA